jgi:heme oxygenase (mycobilin-producing)
MTVKVIIERSVTPESQDKLQNLLKQLRMMAVNQPGYETGETLYSVENPGTHIVISTWHSLSEWQSWKNNPERKKVLNEIDRLLLTPAKESTYIEPWSSLPSGT